MRRKRFCRTSLFQNLVIMMVTLMFLGATMDAMAWQRNRARTGPKGKTSSTSITGNRTGNGGYNRNATTTGPQGNTATRSAEGQWDPVTKTWTKDVTTTGPEGQTATRETTGTKTENGYNSNTTVTGPQGNTATRSAEGQWDPVTKTWTKTVTTSGADQ
ncbi:MAG: hypothetical protein STSR0002_10780 [Smithella sp.]|jgi:hypothetical protein|nr:hypothetical protein [Kiritimatiellia bacterium]